MRGSVVWATVISLLLGCVIGCAAMGAFLLPIQFQLQEEQLAAKQQFIEMESERNEALQKLEDARAKQHMAAQRQQQAAKESKVWEQKYADAVRLLGDTQKQQLNKKP